ncbi:MAG: putative monovalent cation/H+ antiporter subunit A [Planctomycetia bacterium]|nr:putative monovalent cation/H+ antiporter subunit A [Planctomycetia bacterium]
MMTAVLSGFVLALVAPGLYRRARAGAGWLLALLPLGLAGYFGSYTEAVAAGETVRASYSWAPALGVDLSFCLDGLSLLFALLITGIGALILIYAGGYLSGHPQLGRLYAFLLLFMASMLGLVLADNLLALFVFWELTSLSSYLLIGFDHERAEARAAALQALLVTGGGGLALLAGLLLLGQAGGSLELSVLLGQPHDLRGHPLYLPMLLLVLLGAFTKSAQFPFHFWLPGAMAAPTPISAYLHSATMVKAGVYLLARLHPLLGGTDAWHALVTGFGAATMLAGGLLAVTQTDLKRILAYSTVSALGTLVLLLGIGTSAAVTAALVFLLAHALYKGALFLVAGALDHETGTRDVRQLGGLWRTMPVTAAAAGLAALSLAGFAPFLSFIGKELVFEAVWAAPGAGFILAPAAVLAGALFVVTAGLTGVRPFWGAPRATPRPPHEAPLSLWLGPVLLAGSGLLFGLWPALVAAQLVSPAVTAVVGHPQHVLLALWHGFNLALALSGVSLVLGLALYLGWNAIRRASACLEPLLNRGPAMWYEVALRGLNRLAQGQTRLLQSGYLRYYLMIVLVATAGLTGATLVRRGRLASPVDWSGLSFYDAGLALLILLATAAAVLARSRLAAIAALGVVGYSVALVFVLFGAPDVAMTQFLVETLTVILFVLVFYHLPESPAVSHTLARLRDALLAAAVGVLMTGLVLLAGDVQYHPPISAYFAEHSLADAHGRNLVNVILVDFRGLDTLGEITVLAVAGVGVYALLKLRVGAQGHSAAGSTEVQPARTDAAPLEPEPGPVPAVNGAPQDGGLALANPAAEEGGGR